MQAGKMRLSFEWLKQLRNWSLQENFVQFVLVETVKPVNLGVLGHMEPSFRHFHRFIYLRKNNNNDKKTPT